MKKVNVIYWISTGLFAALMTLSAVGGLIPNPQSTTMMQHIGYGPHILPFLSVAKILGVIALLVQRFPLLKEWAYAGFAFDMLGAMYSFIAVGDPVGSWAPIFIGLALLAVSYIYWHKKWKLRTV